MDPSGLPPVPISQLLGGMLIMVCGSFVLYGITNAQVYTYFLNCEEDSKWMRYLVGLVWVLETMHTGFVLRILYYIVIISFGDGEKLAKIDWSLLAIAVAEAIIIGIVQGYYIWRIWILSNRKILIIIPLLFFLIGRLGFTISIGIFSHFAGTWARFQGLFAPNFCVLMTNSFSAVIDGLISIAMIVLLRRGQAGFNQTMDNILRWIIAYTVNTGAITTVVSIIIAITYSTLKENMVFLGLVALTAKLYANTLLGMLNARRVIRQKATSSAGPASAYASNGSSGSRSRGSVLPPLDHWRRKSFRSSAAPQAIMITGGRPPVMMRRADSMDYNPKLHPSGFGEEVPMESFGPELGNDDHPPPVPVKIQVHTSSDTYV